MSTKDKLNEMSNKKMINNNSALDRVTNSRILGVNFNENLSWENRVTKVIKTCYFTLASLRKMKKLTDFKLRKQLSEQLVLSKLSYCDTVFDSLPAYQIKRLQKVMNCAAGFTLGRYATVIDVIKLNWLPVKEKLQFITAKLVHKALYKEAFLDYLKLELTSNIRTLRLNTETRITPFGHKNSFTYLGPTIFNVLLENIKKLDSEKSLFLQLNSISSIKLMFMRYKLLINLAFIFPFLSLSEFNQQIVYINFVWFSHFCFRITTCDSST